MRARGLPAEHLVRSNFRHAHWTIAQMLAHHTVGGCNLRSGDLLGSGTQSGPLPGEAGSLLELTAGGTRPLTLASGAERRYLEDGDRVTLRGRCTRPGFASIGFGEAAGTILPA
jgi:fumarylacetoacetase